MSGRPEQASEHGTYAGYIRHGRRGEDACEACRAAGRDYQRQYRAFRPAARELDRWYTQTRRAAMERLALRHPEELAALLAEERQRHPDPRIAPAVTP